MKTSNVTVVRIYLHEAGSHRDKLLDYLHDECEVRGVTIFRGITGFGPSGKVHTSSLVDMSLDLPLVIEFFDDEDKVTNIINHLHTMIKPGHIVYWSAQMNSPKDT